MSRIGNNPISIPEGVSVNVNNGVISVKGKNGEMNQSFDGVSFDISKDSIIVKRNSESKDHKSKHGLYRALVFNMVTGVTDGFTKDFELAVRWYRKAEKKIKDVKSIDYENESEYQRQVELIRYKRDIAEQN